MAKIAFPRTMRNLDPGKLSSALAENMRYLANVLNQTFNFDHDILSNIGVDDHHVKYLDSEVDTILAVHSALPSDHHTKYTDAEVDTIVATHAAIAAAHHAKYLDSEVDTIVATHTAIVSAHHAKYLDSEVDTIVATHAAVANAHHTPTTAYAAGIMVRGA